MAKLCDIVKPGVPCKVRLGNTKYSWDGDTLRLTTGCLIPGERVYSQVGTLFSTAWEDESPTVESVLRERGYGMSTCGSYDGLDYLIQPFSADRPTVKILHSKRPTTVAQINEIIDLLEKYR